MDEEEHKYLTIYHSNLRNIGLFITISLAIGGFKFKSKFMNHVGVSILIFLFLSISLLLNIQLISLLLRDKLKENTIYSDYILYYIPYITLLLVIILMIRLFYKISKNIRNIKKNI